MEESKYIIEEAQRYTTTYEQKVKVIMEYTCKFSRRYVICDFPLDDFFFGAH
jgi:hypothetical protein